jgi:hypothetical protein
LAIVRFRQGLNAVASKDAKFVELLRRFPLAW